MVSGTVGSAGLLVGRQLRFNMFDAEYTHEGDACTFEVLVRRFAVTAPGIGPLAEIVHDIDLNDGRYGRAETAGVARQVEGFAAGTHDDEEPAAEGRHVRGVARGFRRQMAHISYNAAARRSLGGDTSPHRTQRRFIRGDPSGGPAGSW